MTKKEMNNPLSKSQQVPDTLEKLEAEWEAKLAKHPDSIEEAQLQTRKNAFYYRERNRQPRQPSKAKYYKRRISTHYDLEIDYMKGMKNEDWYD